MNERYKKHVGMLAGFPCICILPEVGLRGIILLFKVSHKSNFDTISLILFWKYKKYKKQYNIFHLKMFALNLNGYVLKTHHKDLSCSCRDKFVWNLIGLLFPLIYISMM